MRWLFLLLLGTASCDDLNRPMGHPRSPSLPPENGSSSTGGAPSTMPGDGGALPALPEGGPATAPTIQPQPGDIQI